MGLGSFLGIKVEKFETKDSISIDALYELIKDVKFDAGTPSLVKHGLNNIIAFPKIDRENQVWIIGKNGKFSVQRSTVIAGVGEMIKNTVTADILDSVTGGVTGLISTFGSPKKTCMALVDKTVETIKALNL